VLAEDIEERRRAAALRSLVAGTTTVEEAAQEFGSDVAALPALAEELTRDLPIEVLERVEALLKTILHDVSVAGASGATARTIARFQQRVGFLLKYKPYAVKCAHPLGYSLFLQNEREGFSFQRHVTHKVEVFHILDVLPGGYVFRCDHAAWEEIYDEGSFAAWLAGGDDPRFERHRYAPRPGDVFVIDELNVVHAVLGCIVEEFATVSTDMVDRLHDQNAGREIPALFGRDYAERRLAELRYPAESRRVDGAGDLVEIGATPIEGGSFRELADDFVRARHYAIEAGERGPLLHDPERAAAVYVTSGAGELIVADAAELREGGDPPPIAVAAGDLLTVVPGVHYRPIAAAAEALAFSEHRIAPDVAFSPDAEHS
jgi:mannose-6-phosphate isomerase-like protein (cupin superfamily)